MPSATTHIILTLILGSFYRDYFVKDKRSFPLHYVLILGIGGILPDIDVAVYWVLYWFGFTIEQVHRTFTHTLIFPLILFIIAGISWKWKNKTFGRHHLKYHVIMIMLGIGVLLHLILDATLAGYIMPLYPFFNVSIGFSFTDILPYALQQIFFPCLDAALIILWLVYLEWKHKISDFI